MNNNSPASSGSSFQVENSGGSGKDIEEQRKRKRMTSNRESARRSRMRKQKHLDEMMNQASQLRDDNNQILKNINMVTQVYENVEAENSILMAQMSELTHRLHSLNDIIMNCVNFEGHRDDMIGGTSVTLLSEHHRHHRHHEFVDCADSFLGSWNLINNQPIMASPDAFMYSNQFINSM